MNKRKMKIKLFLFLVCHYLGIAVSSGQIGSIDQTFNSGDKGFGYGDGIFGESHTTVILGDGKILIGGMLHSYNNRVVNLITRINSDGSLDTSFQNSGGQRSTVYTISLQMDKKIIIGGDFTHVYRLTSGGIANKLARLNSDGTFDTTFNTTIGVSNWGEVRKTAIQSDGKIIIGGSFTTYNGITRNHIARINTNGSLDTSFNPGSGANGQIYGMIVQSDGKILIGGYFTSYNGIARKGIARINLNGSLDTSFNPGAGANDLIEEINIQSDGKIIISGDFTSYNGIAKNRIARINPNGSIDTSFNPGSGANSFIRNLAIQNDGKIIIGGVFTSYNGIARNRIARINTNGSLDTSFNPGSGPSANWAWALSLAIQSNGQIILGGDFTSYNGIARNGIARINTNGNLDISFNRGSGANSRVAAIAIQNDEKIIIGGDFTVYNAVDRNRIARINPNGSLDTSFNTGSGANDLIEEINVQSDGKIIIAGNFTYYNGIARNRIARINPNGSLDTSFNPGAGANDLIEEVDVQSDGKILICGNFTSYNGIVKNRIARINPNGSLDTSFNPHLNLNNYSFSMAIQSDDKIIIGGNTIIGIFTDLFVRINSNGSIDSSFNPGSGTDGTITNLAIQYDGKIIIIGGFTTYNGIARIGIARINPNGSLDTSFDGSSLSNYTKDPFVNLAIQRNGKIIVGVWGQNPDYGFRVKRINQNGSLDTLFNRANLNYADGYVDDILAQNDGNILTAGVFTSINGVGRNRIARIIGSCYSATGVDVQKACNSFTWIDGNTYTTNNNTATYKILGGATNGCDSLIILNLTVNKTSNSSDSVVACNSYKWIDGNIYTSSNNSAKYTMTNSVGCDSIISLRLVINKVGDTTISKTNTTLYANSTSASYQWIDCNNSNQPIIGATSQIFTPVKSGSYAVELTENGCTQRSNCMYFAITSNETINFNNIIHTYPNPTNQILNITLPSQLIGNSITLFNAIGQPVHTKKIESIHTVFDLVSQSAGVYYLEIETPKGLLNKIVIKRNAD